MLPSPSSLGRVAACVRSETLERVEELTEPAALGSTAHDYLRNVNLKGADEAMLAAAPHDREWLKGIDLPRLGDLLDPQKYAPEVAFAYNARTCEARELGRNLTREEARAKALPGELVGTADLVGQMEEGVVVMDFKTGWGWVDPPSINWQVLTYLLMACRTYGKDGGLVGIVRARADGFVYSDTFAVDLFRLEQHEAELRALLERREAVLAAAAAGGELPAFVEGPHCQYCPGRRICPPKTAQLLALARMLPYAVDPKTGEEVEMQRVGGPITQENAALLWDRLKFAEKMVERLRAEVKEWARREPIPLGGGWILGERTKATETVVAERAEHLLEEMFGAELGRVVSGASVETTRKLTKEALGSALRKFALPTMPKVKITKLKESVLQRFREGGAMSVRAGKTIDEHKVKPDEAEALEAGALESEEAA